MTREGPANHDPAVAMALHEDHLAQPWRVVRPAASVRVRALGALDVIEGEHRKLTGVLPLAPRHHRGRWPRGLHRGRRLRCIGPRALTAPAEHHPQQEPEDDDRQQDPAEEGEDVVPCGRRLSAVRAS
jgi:hypothetical protein